MLRISTSLRRSVLPSPLLELILVSPFLSINRPYHPPPVIPNVKQRSSDIPELSLFQALGRLTNTEVESHNRRVSSLGLALGSGDPVRLRDAIEELMSESSIETIPTRNLETISKIFHDHFASCPNIRDSITGAREIAIRVAAMGHLDGLRAYLLLHLKDGDIQGVTSAYDEFAKTLQRPQTSASEQPAAPLPDDIMKPDAVSDFLENFTETEDPTTYTGVADLVMTVVTAYATQDRFYDAFDRFMAIPTTVRVTQLKSKEFCEAHLAHDAALSNKVQAWIRELVHLRLLSRPSSLHKYITGLASNTNITSLQRLYSSTISECRKVGGRCVVVDRGDREGTRRPITLSNAVWDTFMHAFFKCNRADLAETLWSDVTGLGLSPNRHMWNTLLVGYGRHGQCDQAMRIWNRMLEAGIEPNEHAYGAMIQAYFGARRPQEGFALFEQYRIESRKTAEGRQSLHDPTMLPLFNIVLHGLCMNGMDDQAKNVMKDMLDHGPKPDVISYNTFLRYYGRIGDMKSVASVLRAFQPANIQPDVHSFSTLLSALYKGGKRDAHVKVLQIMETMGVKPNAVMYSAIIDFLVRQGGLENFRNAASLLHLMENNPDKDCRPNEVTYTGILAGLHRDPTMPVQDVKLYTEELFGRMYKNGTLPNRTTYHYLIKACLENPEVHGLQMALGYYREMGKRGILLTNRSWYVILSSLLRRGDWAIAGEIINDMFRQGHQPDSTLAALVKKVQRAMLSNGEDI